ncbi:MAG: sugar transferase [Patescibacteria group bacterium]
MFTTDDFVHTLKIKRFFDISGSLILLIVLSPLLFIFFIALLIEQIFWPLARGQLFYCEERISGGQKFKMCKIRTCKQSAIDELLKKEKFVHTAELEKERRNFLSVGWILKKIYLDEAPQLWNVLKGDLSLVGPRPANLVNYQKLLDRGIYTKKIIKSGLTGYFQSYKGWHTESDEEMDTAYIEFCRTHTTIEIFWFDLKILARTFRRVLEHKGI